MYTEVSMSVERISSREFEDKMIALLASRAIIPVDLRLRSLTNFDNEINQANLYTAITSAMSENDLEQWALPDSLPPDAIVLQYNTMKSLIQTELYISREDLFHTLISVTDSYGKDVYNNPASRGIGRRVWAQLAPRFMPALIQEITQAETQPQAKARVVHSLGSVSLRADAINDLIVNSFDEYLELLKGVGDIGRFIIPATMFRSGDYPEMFGMMEQFEDAAIERFRR